MFAQAKQSAPCIIFIDEIDALGGSRHLKEQQALRMTLNQLLVEMDGFESSDEVIVIGATNFAETLDNALTRPGRFDRHVVVPLPDVDGRKEILQHYLEKQFKYTEDIDVAVIARSTPGFSGADLQNLLNIAAIQAAKENAPFMTIEHIEFAKDRVIMGAARKLGMTDEQRKAVAYHESGHAIVALKTKGSLPVHKATILPRGQALGMVSQIPEGDQYSKTFKELLAELDVCMGGRVAEELIYGEEKVSTGATSDFDQATRIASRMVKLYGMSPKLGPVDTETIDPSLLSSATLEIIDQEVSRLLRESYERAKSLLTNSKEELETLAQALITHETLTAEEIVKILGGESLS